MKAPLIALIFSMMVTTPNLLQASVNPCCNTTLATVVGSEPNINVVPQINPDEPFFFQETVFIHIYDLDEKPVIDGEFSRKDLQENKVLKDMLRKSSRFLSIENHHYYYVKKDMI